VQAVPLEQLSQFEPPYGDRTERYVLLDVFTATPLEGNQLAVFTDARHLDGAQMQRLALELRLSESVFVLAPEQGGDVRIRIFTPTAELPFAGHPVLGTAVLVGSALELRTITLETAAGAVAVRLISAAQSGSAAFAWIQQPIPTWEPSRQQADLLAALGIGRSGLPIETYTNGPSHAYVELDSDAAVAALAPDMRALASLGVQANCFAGSGRRWKTRMFAPGLGVPEDPATGSAAGPLALHLSRHGRIAFGEEIEISQGQEVGRPSLLCAVAHGSSERIQGVEVGGSAVIVGQGWLRSS
jgi:trans-2,3-dihydro-3-hydroxyanthranilate isomerase